jgi:choline kinase
LPTVARHASGALEPESTHTPFKQSRPITTALLLAAGTGSRLQPLTNDAPKCLTEVNGISILKRLIRSLQLRGFKRVVVVVGHLDRCIREALLTSIDGLTVEFIHSDRYRTTNNIYSLWMARHAIQEPFLLIESDLIFDTALLDDMLEPDRIAVSHALPWMNGTTVTLDRQQQVTGFHAGGLLVENQIMYKTVNMYSFSPSSWQKVATRLSEHITAGRVNEYYEVVFAELVAEGALALQAAFFDNKCWYEIDTLEDLSAAERLFPKSPSKLTQRAITHPSIPTTLNGTSTQLDHRALSKQASDDVVTQRVLRS